MQKLFYKYTGKKREDINAMHDDVSDGTKELLIVDEDDHNKVVLLPQAQDSNRQGKKTGVKTFASPSNTINSIKRALSRDPTQTGGGNNRKKPESLTTAERTQMVDLLLLDPQQRAILHLTSLPSSSCTPSEMEALIEFYRPHPRILNQLLQTVIMIEVEQSRNDTSLFRSNSVGVKFLSAFALSVGRKYLFQLLQPAIEEVLVVDRSLEVNPARLQSETQAKAKEILENDEGNIEALQKLMDVDMSVDTVERNRKKLLELVDDSFLASIFENKLEMPHVLRRTFTFLRECVRQRYTNSANMALGGFLFLRFFCPVIVAPHLLYKQTERTMGISGQRIVIEANKTLNAANGSNATSERNRRSSIPVLPGQLSKVQQRNLTLIAKILQKIASDSDVFKEKYMTFCNPCIIKRRKEAYVWYEQLCYEDVGGAKKGNVRGTEIILPGDDKNEAALPEDNRKHSIHDESDDDEDITVQDFNSLKIIIGLLARNTDAMIKRYDSSVKRGSIVDMAPDADCFDARGIGQDDLQQRTSGCILS